MVQYKDHKKYLSIDHELWEGYLGRPQKVLKASDWKRIWEENGGGEPLFGMKWLSIFHQLPYWGIF